MDNPEKYRDEYVTDVTYTMNYKLELNPLNVKFNFLCAGLRPPEINKACELGFGQGLTINFHASGSTTQWYGNDFNHKHYLFANELASASKANCLLTPESFQDFCHRTDLPNFDFIGLHGIWSWINDENRDIIIEFIKNKLNPKGVVYISYNAFPGLIDTLPIKKLLSDYYNELPEERDTTEKVVDSIQFLENFLNLNPEIINSFPNLTKKLALIKTQPKHYLAHEYFNKHWRPFYFTEMNDILEPLGLKYAAPAYLIDLFRNLYLTDAQHQFIERIENTNSQQNFIDKIINRQFRAEYWVKNFDPLSEDEYLALISQVSLLAIKPVDTFEIVFSTYSGRAEVNEKVAKIILCELATHEVKTIADIYHAHADKGIALNDIATVAALLIYKKDITLVQSPEKISELSYQCKNLNTFILARSIISDDINFMVSPRTGGGVFVNNIEQLYILARIRGLKTPEEWVKFAWDVNLWRSGKILDDQVGSTFPNDINGKEMIDHAIDWEKNRLPVLNALLIT